MGYEKAKCLNEKILHKAVEKLDKRVDNGSWDNEEFEVISQALDNIKDIEKIEGKKDKEELQKAMSMKKNAETETTEFEQLIYDIAEINGGYEGMLAITTIIADHMEDTRILHPKSYQNIMLRLKELKK